MRRKILHVTQTTGGVETSLLLLLKHLDRSRFTLHLACPPRTSLAAGARALNVPVFEIPMVRNAHPLHDVVALGRLMSLVRREQYDIVHGHSAKGGYLARAAARLTGATRTIYHPRAFSYLSQRGLARAFFLQLERWAVAWTDLVIATSESERRRAIDEVHFPEHRVVTIPNSVDFAEVNGRGARRPQRDGPVILTVGRLSYQKNPQMFVRVAQRVAARRPDVRFVMAGGGFAGPLEAEVRRMVAATSLENRITIVPWSSKRETLDAMASCDVFVLTSRYEGMPNTLLEALMLRTPAVVTDVDGSRDVVAGGAGYAVPLDDDEAMADRIIALLDDESLARRCVETGQAKAREVFDVHRNMDLLAQAYAKLVQV